MSVSRGGLSRGYPRLVERLFRRGTIVGFGDGELLDEFAATRDESAFEAIVIRHGPMVLRVCGQLLRDPNDVDDAFQATFLILARKARSVKQRDLLGNWLYGVAYRVASRSRAVAARRADRLRGLDHVDPRQLDHATAKDPRRASSAWLHEEVRRLPEKFRSPIVLCYFEGLTHEEAAERLRCPLGTLKGRLSRAKDLLRGRLGPISEADDRDLTSRLEGDGIVRAVPPLLLAKAVRSASAISGKSLASFAGLSSISPSILDLVQGVSQIMTFEQIRSGTFIVTLGLGGALLTGASVIAFQGAGPADSAPAASRVVREAPAPAKESAKKPAHPPREGDAVKSGATATLDPVEASAYGAPPDARNPDMARGTRSNLNRPNAGAPARKPQPIERGDDPDGPLRGTNMANVQLHQANARVITLIEQADKSPKSKEALKMLDIPVTMNFPNAMPLEEVVKYIRAATEEKGSKGLPIYVDPRGLEDVNETLQSTVMIDLEGVPLRTTLRLILNQLHLSYCIRDGVVIISSVAGIRSELMQLAAELGIPESQMPKPMFPGFRGGMGGGMGGVGGGMGGVGGKTIQSPAGANPPDPN